MNAAYFCKRWYVTLAQFGRHIVERLETYPSSSSILEELAMLEEGASSESMTESMLVSSTRELVEEFMNDVIARIVYRCLDTPKTKRRRDPPPIDASNTRIQAGYAADSFVVCGGLG